MSLLITILPAMGFFSLLTDLYLDGFYKNVFAASPSSVYSPPSAIRAADHLPGGRPPQPLLQRAGRQRLPRLQESGGHGYGAHHHQLHSELAAGHDTY